MIGVRQETGMTGPCNNSRSQMDSKSETLYREREQRVADAIALRKPDRVPILVSFGSFMWKYSGITCEEGMYDLAKLVEAGWRTNVDFEPDMASLPSTVGPILDALDFRQLRLPGRGLPKDVSFQFVEGEYMKEDEYESFLFDPSDFVIRKYWPRVFGALDTFGALSPFRDVISYHLGVQVGFKAFGLPGQQAALKALIRAGEATLNGLVAMTSLIERLKDAGFPIFFQTLTQAPFDTLGDFLRGTKGLMLDMYRRPDKVIGACDKLLPMMIEVAVNGAAASGNPRVFIPLHKGAEGFMSLHQFKRFYWPTLRELLVAVINEGLTPVVLLEGRYTSRLDIIKEIPERKAIYWFERAEMGEAKKILGERVCIMGNVPMSLLVGGNPDQVKAYCRDVIKTAGECGGYILSSAAVMDGARPDNVKAMFDYVREYGVY